MREPTLARWPAAIAGGRSVDHPSGHWDWLATFAEAAGVPAPAASDGVSLLAALTGRGTQRPGTIYIEYFQNQATPTFADFAPSHRGRKRGQMQNIYIDGHMGVRYNVKSPDDDFEIYNLAKDPQEAHDLGQSPEFAGLQTTMKARVLQLRIPNASAPRPYDKALVPPVKDPGGTPGLTRSLYRGEWPWLPDFRTLAPVSRNQTKTMDVTKGVDGKPFGAAFEGYFYAAQAGEYTFTLANDTGAMLFLHDIRVISEPLKNSAGTFSGSVRLNVGWHPLRLFYRHAGSGNPHLEFTCQQAGGEYKMAPEVFRPLSAKG